MQVIRVSLNIFFLLVTQLLGKYAVNIHDNLRHRFDMFTCLLPLSVMLELLWVVPTFFERKSQ